MSTAREREQLVARLGDVLAAVNEYGLAAAHTDTVGTMPQYPAVLDALGAAAEVVGLTFVEVSHAYARQHPDAGD